MRKITPQLSSFARRLTLRVFLAICIIYSNFANAQLSVTSGTASQGYTLNASATVVDPALTITSGSSINGFRVTISTGLQSSDVLACTGTVPSGVTVVPYNSSTGTLAFTGSTTAANWQTFLRSVTYRCTNTSQVGNRTITFSAGSSSAFTNGHYYELVSSSATWTAAKTAAEGRTYLGLTGYLATITSAAENTFIRQVLNADAWIGCSDDRTYINAATGTSTYANQTAAEGKWYWVTGPEKGTMFTVGNGSPVTQAGQYANWNSGEPNNSGGEHYGEIYSSGSNPGAWNDLPNNSLPYVVEYGGLATDPVQTISANTTIYINITSNTASSAQTVCNGASASALTGSTPAGGTGTYTYVWQSSTTSATSGFSTATGTSNGKNYTPASLTNSTWFRRIVTSGSAVDTTTAVKITVNSAITSSSSTTSVSCYNGSNGAGSVSVSGGTSPYFYSWAPSGGTGASASGLSAGNYTVTITDDLGCTASKSVTITQPASALTNTAASQTNVACNAGTTGAASVTVSGGTSPYTYSWSSGATSASVSSLAAGTYTCTATDANACTSARSFTITQPTAISTTPSSTNVACNGLSTGAASISVSGGTPGYTYQWSNGGSTASKTGLAAGTYTVTVTDANACTSARSFTITQPTALSTTPTTTDVSCNGGSNGVASLSASGGTPSYTYLWSNGGTTATKSGLSAGTYTCTVTDANACTSSRSFTVTQPTALSTSPTSTDVACNGGSNGVASVTASGGTPGYTYLWSNGGTTATKTGLTAGTYTCTITDANACTSSRSFTITQPTAISTTPSSTNVACNGLSTGAASISVSGGTPGYIYQWSNGGSSSSKTGLAAGTYTCTITDANGCTSARSFTITEPSAISTTPTSTDVACNGGSNGAASVAVSGGTPSYTYLWSNGGSTSSKTGLTAGIYTCTITDANACTSALSFTITQPTAITNTATSIDVECNGGNTGSASISISGGTTPYTVTWQSGASGTTLTSLAAGTYNYSITDGNGCLETGSAIVGQPSTLVAAITSTDALCHGESNGTLDASATGGIAPYSYSWNHTTDISSTLSNQSAGSYTCVITDANGCTSTQSVIISEPTTLATTTTQTDVTCNGGNNGIAEITATGGTAPYNYTWNHSSDNVSSFNDLSNGNYQCLITDANGCTTNASFVITEPTAITSTNSTIEPLCNGGTGEASIIASGGTGNLSYNWSNGTTASFDNNLSAGNYTVVITDDNGCSYSTSINITEPTAVQLTITTTDPLCHSGDGSAMVTATGGTGAYTYDWSTGGNTDTESAIYAGSYSLTITDNNGCAYTQNFSIADPAAISTSFTTVSPLCNGGTGEATINASGGTGNLNIQWSSGGTATTESNLSAGVYQVQVMDDNGCLENSSVTISEPAAITYQATVNDEHCNQGNGSISVTATGGTGVLSYNWNTGSSDYEITSLSAGTFDFTIYDQNGCTIMNQVTLNNISAPTVSSSTNNVSCNSDANGTIDISVSGGTAVYNYTWSNGATTEDLSQLIAGTYDYTVTDDANCTTTGSITISEPNALATTATSINETSGNDGSIDLSVTGGTAPYSYTWSNGENSEDISGLTAGNYVVNITDANGCNTSTSIDITSTVGLFQLTGSATQLIVKPNPSNGMLNIEGLSIGDCKIYDAAGRLIKSFANNSTEIKIDLTSLANGVYSIRNFSEKGNNIGRIIISK